MERRMDTSWDQGRRQVTRRLGVALGLGAAAAVTWLGLAAYAAAPAHVRLGARQNARLHEQILVNPGGRTLYHLKTETAHHIRCTGTCEHLWPPLLVRSRSTRLVMAAGASGRLTIVRRPNGRLQVALNGMPLYTFSRDHRSGETNGQGLEGVWFVIPERHAGNGGGGPSGGNGGPSSGGGHEEGGPPGSSEYEYSGTSSSSGTRTVSTSTTVSSSSTSTTVSSSSTKTSTSTSTSTSNGIPQENGGDHDHDNNGGPSDGDGNI